MQWRPVQRPGGVDGRELLHVSWVFVAFVFRRCCDGRRPEQKLSQKQNDTSGTGPWLHCSDFTSDSLRFITWTALCFLDLPHGFVFVLLARAVHGPPGAPRKISGAGRRLLAASSLFHVSLLDIRQAGGQCDLHVFDGRGGVRRVQLASNRRADQCIHHLGVEDCGRAAQLTGCRKQVLKIVDAVVLVPIHMCTALMVASATGHVEVALLLLEAGADRNVADNDGCAALMAACRCVKWLKSCVWSVWTRFFIALKVSGCMNRLKVGSFNCASTIPIP